MSFKIEWSGSPNFTKGRKGKIPIAIVNHITAGAFPGCLNWMQNPQAKASSTYLVTRKGLIYQLVKDEDCHWANGGVKKPNWTLYNGINPNIYTISIEHEGYYTKDSSGKITGNYSGDGNLTEEQYQATLWLHKQIIKKWNIPITRDNIIGHYRIDSINRPNCPGKVFPWDRLFKDLLQKDNQNPIIKVNGKIIEGVLHNNNTYAPTRLFAEILGFKVDWIAKTNEVFVNKIKVDVIMIDGVSFSPVRYLAEKLGKKVNWDEGSQTVTII